jgi:hypothetical protein
MANIKFMTVRAVIEVSKLFPYFLLRDAQGKQLAVNSKIVPHAKRYSKKEEQQQTRYISYNPCSFNEYLTKKTYGSFHFNK